MHVLRNHSFRLLFIAQSASSFGDALVPISLAFAILNLTGSATDLGVVLGTQSAAQVICCLIGGIIADRLPRRLIMITADLARGTAQITLGVLLVTTSPKVVVLAALCLVLGIGAAVFVPAASGLTAALVDPEDLQQANSLQRIVRASAGIAGPAAAGVLIVLTSPGWAILADGTTFFASSVLMARIRFTSAPRADIRWLRDLREGWDLFWNRHWFRDVVINASLFSFLYSGYAVLGPVASKQFYDGAATWSIIATASGVGAVSIGLIAIRLRPRYPLRLGVPVAGIAALAPLSFAGLLPVPVLAVAGALGGGGVIVFATIWQTSMQRHIPDELLSRASSYDWFGSQIAYPLGLAIAGPVSGLIGTRTVLLIIGTCLLVPLAIMLSAPSVRNLPDHPPLRSSHRQPLAEPD